jgi:5-methylcytosine-specific restriction endonuclease McrA
MGGRDHFYQSNAWRRVRYLALQRDRWRCTCCGRRVRDKGSARVELIVPRHVRPYMALVVSNLRTLCIDCAAKRLSAKANKPVERIPLPADGLAAVWR